MPQPDDYKALEAWEQMIGSPQYLITAQQKIAAQEHAPIDAVFKVGFGQWHLLSEVHNPETRQYLQQHHPELFSKAKTR